jgi:hypothetical protein
LEDREVQKILRQRLILVHGIPFDYSYGWDLKSFGRLHDVDKNVSVQGEYGSISFHLLWLRVLLVSMYSHPKDADVRLHQGTLREFHSMTTEYPNEDCPPLNAISLPSSKRNLHIPCQFGSIASHEVARTRLPSTYGTTFEVPDVRSHMEWSLIGGKGSISPFHVDSEGFGTVVSVLHGSKYWIVATRFGESDILSSVDSLGPKWSPYFINEGDNAHLFRFEGLHLQKGDML